MVWFFYASFLSRATTWPLLLLKWVSGCDCQEEAWNLPVVTVLSPSQQFPLRLLSLGTATPCCRTGSTFKLGLTVTLALTRALVQVASTLKVLSLHWPDPAGAGVGLSHGALQCPSLARSDESKSVTVAPTASLSGTECPDRH